MQQVKALELSVRSFDEAVEDVQAAARRWLAVWRVVLTFLSPHFHRLEDEDGDQVLRDLMVQVQEGGEQAETLAIASRVKLSASLDEVVQNTQEALELARSSNQNESLAGNECAYAYAFDSGSKKKAADDLLFHSRQLMLGMQQSNHNSVCTCRFVFSIQHFDEKKIRLMANCMDQFVASVNQTSSTTNISYLALLPPDTLNQVMQFTCSRPQLDNARSGLMHAEFMRHAAQNPDKVAVVYGENSMTYSKLRHESNRIAKLLQSLGVKPEARVGLFLDRSCYIALCQLSVLRAGGAFVPLGLDYPRERVLNVLHDADIDVLLSVSWLQESVEALRLENEVQVVYADIDDRLELFDGENDVFTDVEETNLAYMIYTSGTTGRPKGVMIEHRNISAYLASYSSVLELNERDVVSCLHEYIFDFSIGDVWLCLSAGALLVGFSRDLLMDMTSFCQVIKTHQVTYMTITPALFSLFAEFDLSQVDALTSLRMVDIGGDAVQYDVVSNWLHKYQQHPPVVVNGYGPTEASICCAWEFFSQTMTAVGGHTQSRIGKPLPLYRLYVVNAHGMLLPAGVPGELWIGGHGVGRGYLNEPQQTREKFMANPFGHGGTVYKSGDLCAWNEDGSLLFFGRIDHQVKLRGFRIELGEIESVMRRVNSVQRSVVCVKNLTLVGYVVPRDADTHKVLEACRAHLPSYMVPAGIVALDAFPLTANGKLDTKALPDLASCSSSTMDDSANGGVVQRPVTRMQRVLTKCIAEEMHLDESCIDFNKSFASLGGNSLTAVRVGFLLQNAGFPVSGFSILKCAALKDLETKLESPSYGGDMIPWSKLRADGDDQIYEKPLVCSYFQEQFMVSREAKGHDTENNLPQLLKLIGPLDVPCFRRSIEAIVDRHEILRTTYVMPKPFTFKQIIHKHLDFEFVVDRKTSWGRSHSEIMKTMVWEASQTLDVYSRGPMRVLVHQVSDDVHYVLINIHHTMYDGFSVLLFNDELWSFYDHFTRNGADAPALQLPPLPIQFYDFSEWQHEQVASGRWRGHEEFFKKKLYGVPPLNLPYIPGKKNNLAKKPEVLPAKGVMFSIPKEHVDVLKAIAQKKGLTLFVPMLTLMKMVLASVCSQQDIMMGVVSASRHRSNLDRGLGFYVNGVLMRSQIDLTKRFEEILDEVAKTVSETLEHEEYALHLVMQQFDKVQVSSQLAQVFLLYQDGTQFETSQIGDLTVEEVFIMGEVPPMFDLMMEMIPQEDGSVFCGMGYDPVVLDSKTIDVVVETFTTISGLIAKTRPSERLCIPPPVFAGLDGVAPAHRSQNCGSFGQWNYWKREDHQQDISDNLVFCLPGVDGSAHWSSCLRNHLTAPIYSLEFDERIGHESFASVAQTLATDISRLAWEWKSETFSIIGNTSTAGLVYGALNALGKQQPKCVMLIDTCPEQVHQQDEMSEMDEPEASPRMHKVSQATRNLLEDVDIKPIVSEPTTPQFLLVEASDKQQHVSKPFDDFNMHQLISDFELKTIGCTQEHLMSQSSGVIAQFFEEFAA